MAQSEIEIKCDVTVDPAVLPPQAVFVLECPQRLSQAQVAALEEAWKQGPLAAFKMMIVDSGMKLRAYVPEVA